ncbi:hypothetical protein P7C73_g1478, partial [Tremellales sp. Uapishka_1]
MFSPSYALALLSLVSYVSANGYAGLSIGVSVNFGCSSALVSKAPSPIKNQCSSSGSFFTEHQSSALCCSSQTRTTPSSDLTCPFNWDMHKTAKWLYMEHCQQQMHQVYRQLRLQPMVARPLQLVLRQFLGILSAERNVSFRYLLSFRQALFFLFSVTKAEFSPEWFWHASDKVCKPLTPRSPEPDCSNWSESSQCCGMGSSPSQAASKGGSGGKGGYGAQVDVKANADVKAGGHKRDFNARKQLVAFPQSNLDSMYCPKNLHACSVITASGGAWSYECIDPATELESCGGCASTGEGQDCSLIPHAMSVGCENGVCAGMSLRSVWSRSPLADPTYPVYTCRSGFRANGTECASV